MTDDPETWASLPDELLIYRAESNWDDPRSGFSWTLDAEIAEMHAKRHRLTISRGRISKASALAYITHRGEAEIIVRRESVREDVD